MPKVLKVILIIVLIIVVLVGLIIAGIAFLFNAMMTAQMAPDDYTSQVQTGGNAETKYLAKGNFEVKCFEKDYPENADIKKIGIWYPVEM